MFKVMANNFNKKIFERKKIISKLHAVFFNATLFCQIFMIVHLLSKFIYSIKSFELFQVSEFLG